MAEPAQVEVLADYRPVLYRITALRRRAERRRLELALTMEGVSYRAGCERAWYGRMVRRRQLSAREFHALSMALDMRPEDWQVPLLRPGPVDPVLGRQTLYSARQRKARVRACARRGAQAG